MSIYTNTIRVFLVSPPPQPWAGAQPTSLAPYHYRCEYFCFSRVGARPRCRRRDVSRDPDVGRRLDARRPVVGVVVAEARPQRGAGHEEGHDQGDGELHGVVRQARRQARRRLNLRLVGVGYKVRPVPGLRREGPDVVDPCILFLAALPRLDVLACAEVTSEPDTPRD